MKLFRTLLTLRGHQVVGLSGGNGMLETIEREQPALVLMDIQLPGKDGFALLSEIRRSPHARLRVLALTAHAMQGDPRTGTRGGLRRVHHQAYRYPQVSGAGAGSGGRRHDAVAIHDQSR